MVNILLHRVKILLILFIIFMIQRILGARAERKPLGKAVKKPRPATAGAQKKSPEKVIPFDDEEAFQDF